MVVFYIGVLINCSLFFATNAHELTRRNTIKNLWEPLCLRDLVALFFFATNAHELTRRNTIKILCEPLWLGGIIFLPRKHTN